MTERRKERQAKQIKVKNSERESKGRKACREAGDERQVGRGERGRQTKETGGGERQRGEEEDK